MREFLSTSDRWMYRSFVLNALAVVTLLLVSGGIMLVIITTEEGVTRYDLLTWALTCVVTLTVATTWMLRGVDLRQGRARFELALMLASLILQVGTSYNHPSQVVRGIILICAATVLIVATMLGPIWMVFIFMGVLGIVAFLLKVNPFQIVFIEIAMAVYWLSVKLTLWYVDVMHDLRNARYAERRLAVSEERLRFADDLHDVIGRSLSIISMQAELADQLVARGDESARDHLQKVRSEAAQTMTQMRSLVRGYREPNLHTELQGARKLLQAAGMKVSIHGEAIALEPRVAALAGYFVREAVTNILRHSQAEHVTITLNENRISISNDHPLWEENGEVGGTVNSPTVLLGEGSGIETLRRKLEESGMGGYEDVQVEASAEKFLISMEMGANVAGEKA